MRPVRAEVLELVFAGAVVAVFASAVAALFDRISRSTLVAGPERALLALAAANVALAAALLVLRLA